MDILQEYTPQLLHIYQTTLPYISPLLIPIYTTISTLQRTLPPLLLPYCNRALSFAQSQPAILSVLLFVLFLYAVLRILGFIRRVIAFWVGILVKLVFWGILGILGAAVYQRGVERTVGDLWGWGVVLTEVWWREYERWEGVQKQTQSGGASGYGRDYMAGSRGNTGWR